ncbi:hypothetical protein Daura_48925 [Dactylosporangium aurantiacum]|uniref:Uncharacterized protein n=1 Tax=Dactylosporangium aurantiacum TaxID=35754 RepID=A0A9Q9IK78_9ACTN|nr:hypothetical protein [Dactylosporangium aurantiacum]MDG6107510.1 hypothetical protein [Dactylosporangium aurantiacum]UWZ54300.1 hypothetical protein Daura_48925 [Dactylosporangium aurantiacum]
MTSPGSAHSNGQPGIGQLDADLQRTVRRTSYMRQLFYFVVLLVALAGQVSGAVEALGIPLLWAVPAVGALELGGIVVLANADVRRRLGERATASRVLSAAIAGFAVAFNWMAHENKLMAGFFAGMSALGYLVWLMHTENQRRDRLRATGDLPPTTPAYEVVGHWIRHPWITLRAKNLAKADARLGLYSSLAAARAEKRKEVRTKAIAKVLHRKIRAAVDPTTADIAVAVYDLDEIAVRLADGADYDGLTALIAADLAPARLASDARVISVVDEPAPRPAITETAQEPVEEQLTLPEAAEAPAPAPVPAAGPVPAPAPEPVVSPLGEWRGEIAEILPPPAPRRARGQSKVVSPEQTAAAADLGDEPTLTPTRAIREGSLRSQVHAALHEHVPDNDPRDTMALTTFVGDLLELNDVERLTASNYVRTWKREVDAGRRSSVNGRHLQDVVPTKR